MQLLGNLPRWAHSGHVLLDKVLTISPAFLHLRYKFGLRIFGVASCMQPMFTS